MYVCMYVYIYINTKMMAGCTVKDSTYVWHVRFHVFLFSSEKLEKHKAWTDFYVGQGEFQTGHQTKRLFWKKLGHQEVVWLLKKKFGATLSW